MASVLTIAVLLFASACFLYTGFRGLITKRPSIRQSLWRHGILWWLGTLSVVHQLVSSQMGPAFWASSAGLLLVLAVGLILELRSPSYWVCGATNLSLRMAVDAALAKLALVAEDRPPAPLGWGPQPAAFIHLPGEQLDLIISLSLLGLAHVRIKQPRSGKRLRQIMAQTAHNLNVGEVETNNTAFIINIVLGLITLGFASRGAWLILR